VQRRVAKLRLLGDAMISIVQRFELIRQAGMFAKATACPEHDFTDVSRDRGRRLPQGWLECARCGVRVSVLCAFFYEQGLRHAEAGAGRLRSAR